jgi:hypothetical protein
MAGKNHAANRLANHIKNRRPTRDVRWRPDQLSFPPENALRTRSDIQLY